MSYLEIPLKNNTFTTRVLLINPEEVVSIEAMAAYVYKEPPIHIPSVCADAVIDTGATDTTIPGYLADKLSLVPVSDGECEMASGDKVKCEQYLVMICFPQKHIVMQSVLGIRGDNHSDILIGMDFLWGTNFQYRTNFLKDELISPYGGKLTIEIL